MILAMASAACESELSHSVSTTDSILLLIHAARLPREPQRPRILQRVAPFGSYILQIEGAPRCGSVFQIRNKEEEPNKWEQQQKYRKSAH
jgi:hypothetical protein